MELDEGVANIESMNVLKLKFISDIGTPVELGNAFGCKKQYLAAITELENQLYKAALNRLYMDRCSPCNLYGVL